MCNIVVRFGGVSEVGQDDTRISLSHVSKSYEYCTKTLVVLVYAHESVFVVRCAFASTRLLRSDVAGIPSSS